MNLLLAGFLFAAVNTYTGVPTTTIGKVEPNTPAYRVGLQVGDRIVEVDNHPVHSWNQLVSLVVASGYQQHQVKPIHIVTERNGSQQDLVITPELVKGTPVIGIETAISHNPVRTLFSGFAALGQDIVLTVHGYVSLFVHHQFQSLSGPVGIADVITQQVRFGFWNVVAVAGALSLGLGLFNLLPIPALDGGRLLFMIIELIRGRRVDPEKETLVHFVGFALVMLFAVVITYRDVTKLF